MRYLSWTEVGVNKSVAAQAKRARGRNVATGSNESCLKTCVTSLHTRGDWEPHVLYTIYRGRAVPHVCAYRLGEATPRRYNFKAIHWTLLGFPVHLKLSLLLYSTFYLPHIGYQRRAQWAQSNSKLEQSLKQWYFTSSYSCKNSPWAVNNLPMKVAS